MAKIDPNRILAACEESMFGMTDMGFCLACGEEQLHVEPDAEHYTCEGCGATEVYGAEMLLVMGYADGE